MHSTSMLVIHTPRMYGIRQPSQLLNLCKQARVVIPLRFLTASVIFCFGPFVLQPESGSIKWGPIGFHTHHDPEDVSKTLQEKADAPL